MAVTLTCAQHMSQTCLHPADMTNMHMHVAPAQTYKCAELRVTANICVGHMTHMHARPCMLGSHGSDMALCTDMAQTCTSARHMSQVCVCAANMTHMYMCRGPAGTCTQTCTCAVTHHRHTQIKVTSHRLTLVKSPTCMCG